MLCYRQSETQFKSKNFCNLVEDYLPREEDIQSLVTEMKEHLSNAYSSDPSSSTNNRVGRYIPNPNDNSKVLQIDGALLPQNNTVLLLTAVVNEFKK